MTPVDFLIKELKPFLKEKDYVTTDVIFSVAKQLEKQQNLKLSKTPQITSFDTLQWKGETTKGNNE